MSTQFTGDIEVSTRSNTDVSKAVQEALRTIESHLGTDSDINKRLCSQQLSYERLKERLEIVEPTLTKLDYSVESLIDTERNLVQGIADFDKKLNEAQFPAGNPILEKDLTLKYAENTQLQLRLQEAMSDIKSLEQQLFASKATNENLKQSVTDANAQRQTAADLNRQLESEKQNMQRELGSTERRLRAELDEKHNSIVDQINRQHQNELDRLNSQLQDVVQNRNELEESIAELLTQLEGVRKSLVGSHLPVKTMLADGA